MIQAWLNKPRFTGGLAILGALIYLAQAVHNAFIRTTFLDEGLYLVKGWLFASGRFQPYQAYGPWTNQMPLSYYIPGLAQVLFGPGLRTGRFFAIFLALLMLLALWLVTRRLAGSWWAAGVVWALALNIASVKVYTLAISEVIVACMVAWVLFFILGDQRRLWQVVAGASLATAIFFVRINLAPFVVLVVLYIFWQHGKRSGWASLIAAGAVFCLGHALFWPGIMANWAPWMPEVLKPWFDAVRLVSPSEGWVTSEGLPDLFGQLLYFFLSFRLHILSLGGAVFVWFLWPGKAANWRDRVQLRTAIFLSVTLIILFVIHVQAAFSLGYCPSCVLMYVVFFDYLGLILLAQSFSALPRRLSPWRAILVIEGVIVFGMGLVFSAYEEISRSVLQFASKWLIVHQAGYYTMFQSFLAGLSPYKILQLKAVLIFGSLILALLFLVSDLINQLIPMYPSKIEENAKGKRSFRRLQERLVDARFTRLPFVFISVSLVMGLVFSPSQFLSRGNDYFYCGGNVLASYEAAGNALHQMIPAGSKVFWIGRIPAVFLYLPDVEMFPAQLNHFHNFRYGGDDQELELKSRWNESLARKWLGQADVILIEEAWNEGWVKELVDSSNLVEQQAPPLPESCRADSLIHVYMKP